jgi:hypothetical protein
MSEARDGRERTLRKMIAAARREARPVMSDDDAERVLSHVLVRARAKAAARRRVRPVFWLAGLAAAATICISVADGVRRTETPALPAARVARETFLHTTAEGREVFIHIVAYETEE